MISMERELSKAYKATEMANRNFLREFVLEVRSFSGLQSSVVWRVLYFGRHPPFLLSLGTDHSEQHRGSRKRQGKIRKGNGLENEAAATRGLQARKKRRFSNDAIWIWCLHFSKIEGSRLQFRKLSRFSLIRFNSENQSRFVLGLSQIYGVPESYQDKRNAQLIRDSRAKWPIYL